MLNNKTERKRRDERDGVLTFGQGWMIATEELAGVGEDSLELGKTTESTSDSRDRPHHDVELDEGNSKVVSVCIGTAQFHQKSSPESSPEFSRCRSSARVSGSEGYRNGMRLVALERGRQGDRRPLFIGRDWVRFYFPFYLISEINFGLKIIP
jgi:hypothetical protein